jgi:UPF0176 protein
MDKKRDSEAYIVILFYKFLSIADPEALRVQQLSLCQSLGLTGRLIIATEGINGTFEGTVNNVAKYIEAMHRDARFADISFKKSIGTGAAFPKLKIKVRDEIVALNPHREIDPTAQTAVELTASELQQWYDNDEDFVVLDLRNDYEIESGYFDKTINPGLDNFRDLTEEKINELATDERLKGKKVLTVCTGGIRCEKATCLMNDERFPELYQLKDGIHTYMEQYPNQHFKGTLFVFDNRSVTDLGAGEGREVVSKCEYCDEATENYVNDDSQTPSRKLLCCQDCYQEKKDILRAFVSNLQV